MDEDFKKFIVVVEKGNITESAALLGISQPGLTLTLQKIEKYFSTPLLIRSRKGVILTPAGEQVYIFAKNNLQNLNDTKSAIDRLILRDNSELKLGMIDSVGSLFVGEIYTNYRKLFPNLRLNLFIDNSTNLVEMVTKGKIDIAIITLPQFELSAELFVEKFATEELILVGVPEIISQIKNEQDIKNFNFITYNQNSHTYRIIMGQLNEWQVSPFISVHSTSPQILKELISMGRGIGYLPISMVSMEISSSNLATINWQKNQLKRDLALVCRRKCYISKSKEKFISLLKKELNI